MIADLDATDPGEWGEPPEYDLCIVGSGPAGLTVASELADAGLSLCVLESGRAAPTPHGDRLRHVVSDGIAIKEYSRERVLGGASTTWAGLSSPLDARDMQPRAQLGGAGWPIAREELLGYYAQAAERYRFPPLALFEPDGFGALRDEGDLQPDWERVEEKVFLAAAEPQDFGREQRHVFERERVDLWLDATVLRLESSLGDEDGGTRVEAAVARSRGGREVRVRARGFVLACGGIENARLLLASRLGNERDQVGRYLMNHPKNYHGIVRLTRPLESLPYYFGCLHRGFAGYAGLRLCESVQRERGLLNSYVRLEPLFPWSDGRGVEALVLLVKHSRGLFARWKARRRDEVVELRDYAETGDDSALANERRSALGWLALAGTVALHLPRVLQYAFFRLSRRRPLIRRVRLRNFMEMEPSPDNRVLLSDERDAYGQPVPLVRHRCTALDRRSLVELHDELERELPRAGFGELETALRASDPWPIDQDASHHMGTTRMGTDPHSSVTDPECRIHGVANAWVAGASLFPTSGCANPTFTIVALAIRLARHLRRELARPAATRGTA